MTYGVGYMINIYRPRRGKFRLCEFWLRDESNYVGDLSKWVIDKKPSGQFYAKPISEKTTNSQQLSNVFMFDQDNITLETEDEINIKRGAVVKYAGKYWMVDSFQLRPHLKETEFIEEEYTTFIRIRK